MNPNILGAMGPGCLNQVPAVIFGELEAITFGSRVELCKIVRIGFWGPPYYIYSRIYPKPHSNY